MGLFDDSTRKLAGDAFGRYVKPERLAGHYEIYEGYDEHPLSRFRRLSRTARKSLQAALDREALAMGAVGLAVGVAIGAALMYRRSRR